jgi:hypothetical protein
MKMILSKAVKASKVPILSSPGNAFINLVKEIVAIDFKTKPHLKSE